MYLLDNNINIPEQLLDDCEEGKIVFFCGAGVSQQIGFSNFKVLLEKVYQEIKVEPSNIEKNYIKSDKIEFAFDCLEKRVIDGSNTIRKAIKNIFDNTKIKDDDCSPHKSILEILYNSSNKVKIITTNYDNCFETVAKENNIKIQSYEIRHFPRELTNWNGIVHIHGKLDNESIPNIIFTAEDYGEAYFFPGFINSFLENVFRNYSVCFIGYSFNDAVFQYILKSIGKNTFKQNIYCFTQQEFENNIKSISSITQIIYKEHSDLWKTIDELSEMSKNYTDYKINTIKKFSDTKNNNLGEHYKRILWALKDTSGKPSEILSKEVKSLDYDSIKIIDDYIAKPLENDKETKNDNPILLNLYNWYSNQYNNPEFIKVITNRNSPITYLLGNTIKQKLRELDYNTNCSIIAFWNQYIDNNALKEDYKIIESSYFDYRLSNIAYGNAEFLKLKLIQILTPEIEAKILNNVIFYILKFHGLNDYHDLYEIIPIDNDEWFTKQSEMINIYEFLLDTSIKLSEELHINNEDSNLVIKGLQLLLCISYISLKKRNQEFANQIYNNWIKEEKDYFINSVYILSEDDWVSDFINLMFSNSYFDEYNTNDSLPSSIIDKLSITSVNEIDYDKQNKIILKLRSSESLKNINLTSYFKNISINELENFINSYSDIVFARKDKRMDLIELLLSSLPLDIKYKNIHITYSLTFVIVASQNYFGYAYNNLKPWLCKQIIPPESKSIGCLSRDNICMEYPEDSLDFLFYICKPIFRNSHNPYIDTCLNKIEKARPDLTSDFRFRQLSKFR